MTQLRIFTTITIHPAIKVFGFIIKRETKEQHSTIKQLSSSNNWVRLDEEVTYSYETPSELEDLWYI